MLGDPVNDVVRRAFDAAVRNDVFIAVNHTVYEAARDEVSNETYYTVTFGIKVAVDMVLRDG